MDTAYVEDPNPPHDILVRLVEQYNCQLEDHRNYDTLTLAALKKCFTVKPIDPELKIKQMRFSWAAFDINKGKLSETGFDVEGNKLNSEQHKKFNTEMEGQSSFMIYITKAEKNGVEVLAKPLVYYLKQ